MLFIDTPTVVVLVSLVVLPVVDFEVGSAGLFKNSMHDHGLHTIIIGVKKVSARSL